MATYTYPLTPPSSPAYTRVRFQLQRLTGITQSPFTGKQQTQVFQGFSLWTATFSLPPMKREQAAEWQAFFFKLRGRSGTFEQGDPDAKQPQGAGAGTIRVNGAHSARATTIAVDGFTNSNGTIVLKAGDYIQIGSTLHMVVDDATCNSSGQASLNIEPAIKVDVANNTVCAISNTKAVWRLDSDLTGWDANHVSLYGISFSCTEAF